MLKLYEKISISIFFQNFFKIYSSEFRNGIDFTRLTNSEPVQDLRIYVCVRKRPINKKGN